MKTIKSTIISTNVELLEWNETKPSEFVMSRKGQPVVIDINFDAPDGWFKCVAADPKFDEESWLHSWWQEYSWLVHVNWLEDYIWEFPERAKKYMSEKDMVIIREPQVRPQQIVSQTLSVKKDPVRTDREMIGELTEDISSIFREQFNEDDIRYQMSILKLKNILLEFFYVWK